MRQHREVARPTGVLECYRWIDVQSPDASRDFDAPTPHRYPSPIPVTPLRFRDPGFLGERGYAEAGGRWAREINSRYPLASATDGRCVHQCRSDRRSYRRNCYRTRCIRGRSPEERSKPDLSYDARTSPYRHRPPSIRLDLRRVNQLSIDEQKDPGILSHGIDFGHTQHELPMDLVGRVANHQVLGCGLEVTQAPLQHAGVVQRPG